MQDNEDDNELFCEGCQEHFDVSDFDDVDDEFDPSNPLCPDCKRAKRIGGAICVSCDERPAAHEVELGPLCEDCFDNYADGYARD